MSFDFISGLTESRMLPSINSFRKFNAKDIADLIYLNAIALTILKNEFDYMHVSSEYARKTVQAGNINDFRASGTDLYLLMHVLFGSNNQKALDTLKDPRNNEQFMNRITLDWGLMRRWLQSTAAGRADPNADRRLLIDLEKRLYINNSSYQAIRRLAQEWYDLDNREKSLCLTRLLQAIRARAGRSELRPYLENLAKRQSLEIKDAANTETGYDPSTKSGSKFWRNAAIVGAAGIAGVISGIGNNKK